MQLRTFVPELFALNILERNQLVCAEFRNEPKQMCKYPTRQGQS